MNRVKEVKISKNFILESKRPIKEVYTEIGIIDGENNSKRKVTKIKHKVTGELKACKHIDITNICDIKLFQQEIEIMMKLDHPNIVRLFEVYQDYKNIFLVMELCEGGELSERIHNNYKNNEPLSEKEVSTIMEQILSAVYYCHKNKICHRDLKLENILFVNKSPTSQIKIIDFGLSKIMKNSKID